MSSGAPEPTPADLRDPEGLRPALVAFREKHSLPALGGGVTTKGGSLDVDVVGVRVREGGEPVRLDDPWHLGSCGKSITAALYARLVEAGSATWGARLPDLFPDLAATVDPAWGDVTIDSVFFSEGGFPANLGHAEMVASFTDTRPLPEQRTQVAAAALARRPHRPGRFLYSNLGYVVIGAAIERITGVPYETALATHVLEPLGITSGGFGPPRGAWGHGGRRLSLGPLVVDLGRGKPADPDSVESDNPAVMSPAGRLHLTLEDWARFQRVFLAGHDGFLRPETIDRLLTPSSGEGYRQAYGWMRPQISAVSYGQQGSNTLWNAVAVIDAARERSAMAVCNDGRGSIMRRLPELAVQLLG